MKAHTRPPALEPWVEDLRYAVRTLGKSPGFACATILSLTLGIGDNTAIFSLINSLVLRTLPVKDPSLVLITPGASTGTRFWSYAFWEQVRQRPTLYESAAAWSPVRFNIALGGETQFVEGLWVSGSFFEMLGVPALRGRSCRRRTTSEAGVETARRR